MAQLASIQPPKELRGDHLILVQSSNHLITAIANVEQIRPSASLAAAKNFPSIWRQIEERNRYYDCYGSDDFWGYGQMLFDAPTVVYDFEAACVVERQAFSFIGDQIYELRRSQQYE